MRVVIDTNVLVSALLFGGNPSKVVELAKEGALELFLSPFILEELKDKLTRKFAFSNQDAIEACSDLEMMARMVHPHQKINVIKRKDSDNRILECSIAAEADILVTGDLQDIRPLGHFHGTEILTPKEFLDKYFPHF